MRRAGMALVLLLGAIPLMAQTGDTPLMGSSGMNGDWPAPTAPRDEPQRLLVLGDAIGGGLGAGLLRAAETDSGLEVVLRFNEESGLARPEVYDWIATVPKILENASYDVIVVMLGANDRQFIREGELRHAFGSEAWTAAYRKRIDSLLDRLQASGARIVWVPPPPMLEPDYDNAVRAIAALQRERVEARGMTFLDIRPQLSGSDGGFTETVLDADGNELRLRGRDGISFFKAGNNFMARLVQAAIARAAPLAPESPPEAPAADAALPSVPVFGQELADGGFYTVQPEGVTANAMLVATAGLGPGTALQTLRDVSPSGSAAERLFRFGAMGPAPSGRADDFSAPPDASE
jgi:hypothetical protein